MTTAYLVDSCLDCSLNHNEMCHHPKRHGDSDEDREIPDVFGFPSWCPLFEEAFWMELSSKAKREKADE